MIIDTRKIGRSVILYLSKPIFNAANSLFILAFYLDHFVWLIL